MPKLSDDVINDLFLLTKTDTDDTNVFVTTLHSLKHLNKIGLNNQKSLTELLLKEDRYCECVQFMAQMCLVPYKYNPEILKMFKEISMLPKYSHQTTILSKHYVLLYYV